MNWQCAATPVVVALMMSVAGGPPAAGTGRVDHKALGGGWIVVFGKGVSVRVTDPLDRITEWNGNSMSCGIPRCAAVGEEPVAEEEDSQEDKGPETLFTLSRLTPGEYRIDIKARQDVDVHLLVHRHSNLFLGRDSIKNPTASADSRARLRKGQRAAWRLNWGCTEASDTCWAVLRPGQGSADKGRRPLVVGTSRAASLAGGLARLR